MNSMAFCLLWHLSLQTLGTDEVPQSEQTRVSISQWEAGRGRNLIIPLLFLLTWIHLLALLKTLDAQALCGLSCSTVSWREVVSQKPPSWILYKLSFLFTFKWKLPGSTSSTYLGILEDSVHPHGPHIANGLEFRGTLKTLFRSVSRTPSMCF